MFVWGENDFVAIPKYCAEMAYEFLHGDLKVTDNEFLWETQGENMLRINDEVIKRVYGDKYKF
jgi:hypothetical protein